MENIKYHSSWLGRYDYHSTRNETFLESIDTSHDAANLRHLILSLGNFLSYCTNNTNFLVLADGFLFSSSTTSSLWETAAATAAPSLLQKAAGEDKV